MPSGQCASRTASSAIMRASCALISRNRSRCHASASVTAPSARRAMATPSPLTTARRSRVVAGIHRSSAQPAATSRPSAVCALRSSRNRASDSSAEPCWRAWIERLTLRALRRAAMSARNAASLAGDAKAWWWLRTFMARFLEVSRSTTDGVKDPVDGVRSACWQGDRAVRPSRSIPFAPLCFFSSGARVLRWPRNRGPAQSARALLFILASRSSSSRAPSRSDRAAIIAAISSRAHAWRGRTLAPQPAPSLRRLGRVQDMRRRHDRGSCSLV